MNVRGLREALTRLVTVAALLSIASAAKATPTIDISIESVGPYDNYSQVGVATTEIGHTGTYGVSNTGYGSNFNCDWSIVVNPDPTITGTFTLNNISTATQTFIITVSLNVSPGLSAPTKMGGFFSQITYTDLNSNGVTLATVPPNPFYRAQIDGNPLTLYGGDLGLFSLTGGAGSTNTISGMSFGDPIPSQAGPALNTIMTIRHQFSLTAGDQVQFNSMFQVEAPEPGSVLLIGLGLAGLVARKLSAR